jgi:type IV pilus assembly protein PilF
MMGRRAGVILAAALGLSACAGTGQVSEPAAGTARQAAEINASLGREYMDRGQYEVALEKLKKAISADPDYAPGHTLMAVLYEQIGEMDLAERHYRKAVEASPDNGDVNNNFGVFLCGTGERKAAEAYFLQAVKDPFYSTPEVAFANLGSCMMEQDQLDKAERYLRRSLEYNKAFPDALLAMARLELRNSDFLGARAFLQRFEANGAESAESLWLGMRIEARLNDPLTAKGYEARLLSRFPDSPEAYRARATVSDD